LNGKEKKDETFLQTETLMGSTLPSKANFRTQILHQKLVVNVVDVIVKAWVNFINILRPHFSYESASSSFSLVTAWLCDLLAKGYQQKKLA